MASQKKVLGKGLGALISMNPDMRASAPVLVEPIPEDERILQLDPHAIQPNPQQPRTAFDEEALDELAESIKRHGVQEPVIVRRVRDTYELVSGERRVRASIMAGVETVPAICRDVSDRDMLRLGLIENIQREDLNPIELAKAYQALIDEFEWTQEQLSAEVGKKRVTVTNTLRLLNLPPEIQRFVIEGSLTMGHARALLAIESAEGQRATAQRIILQGLSVRQAEKMAAPKVPRQTKLPIHKDPNIAQIEDELRHRLSTKVIMRTAKNNRGKIEIEYYNLDDLDRILAVLRGSH